MKSENPNPVPNLAFLQTLVDIIHQRKEMSLIPTSEAKSYTVSLFKKGLNKIAQKVGEEAVELVIEAKDNDAELFKNEAADLVFHLLVLLEEKDISLTEVIAVLESRHHEGRPE